MFGTFLPCVFNFWNLFGHLNFDYMNFIIIFFFLRATVPNLRKFKKKGVFGCNVIHIHQKNQHLNKFLNREFLTLLRCWKQIGGCITMTFIIFCVFIIIIFSTFPPNLFLELKYWKTTDNKYCFKTILREIDLTMQNKTNALQQHLKYHIQFILLTIKL